MMTTVPLKYDHIKAAIIVGERIAKVLSRGGAMKRYKLVKVMTSKSRLLLPRRD